MGAAGTSAGGGLGNIFTNWGSYLSGRRAAGDASRMRGRLSGMTGPKEFWKRTDKFLPKNIMAQEMGRASAADALAGQEANQLASINTAAGRSGLGGSGAHLMARAGTMQGRQSGLNQALMQKYQQAMAEAQKQARISQMGQAKALASVPSNDAGSFWEAPLGFVGDLLNSYQGPSGGGGGGGMMKGMGVG